MTEKLRSNADCDLLWRIRSHRDSYRAEKGSLFFFTEPRFGNVGTQAHSLRFTPDHSNLRELSRSQNLEKDGFIRRVPHRHEDDESVVRNRCDLAGHVRHQKRREAR